MLIIQLFSYTLQNLYEDNEFLEGMGRQRESGTLHRGSGDTQQQSSPDRH